ncbi:hypothetical protein Z949_1754 [Sulfitobacter guttiformis KCTC 32187]|nr:hypothetical protein Z949_1754 [Sulfitobacter guttiformis KCTC 32187]
MFLLAVTAHHASISDLRNPKQQLWTLLCIMLTAASENLG